MTLFIVSVVVAMTVSFFCSILEAALLSLSLTDIARMEKKNPRLAAIWLSFKKNISKPIAVILVADYARLVKAKPEDKPFYAAIDAHFQGFNCERMKTQALNLATVMQIKIAQENNK